MGDTYSTVKENSDLVSHIITIITNYKLLLYLQREKIGFKIKIVLI